MEGKKRKMIWAGSVALLFLAGLLVWGWQSQKTPPLPPQPPKETVGQEIGGTVNPAEKLPETNPFKTKTNPFENVYKNPFE